MCQNEDLSGGIQNHCEIHRAASTNKTVYENAQGEISKVSVYLSSGKLQLLIDLWPFTDI